MCRELDLAALKADARLANYHHHVRARDWMLPRLRACSAPFTASGLAARFERIGLPFAPITQPQDLFDDPHLMQTGGLAEVTVPADASGAGREISTHTALLPITLDGERLALRSGPPALGADSAALLGSLGYSALQIETLRAEGVIAGSGCDPSDSAASG